MDKSTPTVSLVFQDLLQLQHFAHHVHRLHQIQVAVSCETELTFSECSIVQKLFSYSAFSSSFLTVFMTVPRIFIWMILSQMSVLLVLEGVHTNTHTRNLNSDLHRHNHTDTHMHSHTSTHMDVRTVSCLYNMHVCMHTLNSKPSPHSHSIFHILPMQKQLKQVTF